MQDESDTAGAYDLAPEEPTPEPERPHTNRLYQAQPRRALTCPNCGYDVSKSNPERCPECGLRLTRSAIERAYRPNFRDLYAEPLLYLVVGLVIASAATLINLGVAGLVAMLIYFGITIAVGLVVFYAMSLMWIGLDQPIPAAVVMISAAYAGSFGVSWGVGLFLPVLGWIGGIAALILLLVHFLDIEWVEAVAVAVVSFAIKFVGLQLLAYL